VKQTEYGSGDYEASARFAEFGPFYISYIMRPAEMLDYCRIA
jgi:peroxiredoxin